jgi:flagellar biosynthetic protein FliQ
MNISDIMAVGQHALWVMILIAAPLLLSGLVAGLLISILQAATQVNELTLSFVPKILVMALVLLLAGSWMLNTLMDFTVRLVHSIPGLIGG